MLAFSDIYGRKARKTILLGIFKISIGKEVRNKTGGTQYSNTSIAAPGAVAHGLQRLTTF